jgi:hypothetical protein
MVLPGETEAGSAADATMPRDSLVASSSLHRRLALCLESPRPKAGIFVTQERVFCRSLLPEEAGRGVPDCHDCS